jgi:hypothetical protein
MPPPPMFRLKLFALALLWLPPPPANGHNQFDDSTTKLPQVNLPKNPPPCDAELALALLEVMLMPAIEVL